MYSKEEHFSFTYVVGYLEKNAKVWDYLSQRKVYTCRHVECGPSAFVCKVVTEIWKWVAICYMTCCAHQNCSRVLLKWKCNLGCEERVSFGTLHTCRWRNYCEDGYTVADLYFGYKDGLSFENILLYSNIFITVESHFFAEQLLYVYVT